MFESGGAQSENEQKKWDSVAKSYENEVFSITILKEVRQRILEQIEKNNNKLIIGCGSNPTLPKDLLESDPNGGLICSDFSKGMLESSKQNLENLGIDLKKGDIKHIEADNRKLPFKNMDRVITTNSIIPENCNDVREMFKSVFDSLDEDGKFIGFFPAFDFSEQLKNNYPDFPLKIDVENKRVFDTGSWQTFHTKETLMDNLKLAGFENIKIEKVPFNSVEAKEALRDIYGTGDSEFKEAENYGVENFYEYFVVAEKGDHNDSKGKLPDYKTKGKIEVTAKGHLLESLNSAELTEENIQEMTDFYRYVFNNTGHFWVYPKSGEFVSAKQVAEYFGHNIGDKDYVDLELMDELSENKIELYPRSISGEKAQIYHDPEKTKEVVKAMMGQTGSVCFLRDLDGSVIGLSFGYVSDLRNVFENEEYKNRYRFMANYEEKNNKSYDFFEKSVAGSLKEIFDIDIEDVRFFSWSCIGTKPKVGQGLDVFLELASKMLNNIPKNERKNMFLIGQNKDNSKARKLYQVADIHSVPELFDGESSVLLSKGDDFINTYNLSLFEFKNRLVTQLRAAQKLEKSREKKYAVGA